MEEPSVIVQAPTQEQHNALVRSKIKEPFFSFHNILVTIKLDSGNYIIWKH